MTQRRDLDREMAAYFERRSTSRAAPEILDAAMARIETTRQRPGWLVVDRWPAAEARGGVARAMKVAILLAALVMLAALTIGLALYIGSRHRLPPPIGPARPGLIAFDLAGDLYVANADLKGIAQVTAGPDADSRATFSPDGTMIAYESQLADDLSTSLIVMGADGGHRTTIADHLAEAGSIVWSPDSRKIAVGSRLVGDVSFHIFVAEVEHPGALELGGPDLLGIEPSWSPDGTRIAFKHIDPCCGTATLWLMNADGTDRHELSSNPKAVDASWDNALRNTTWSPDGRWLAFLAAGDGGAYDVYVIGSDGRGQLDISNSPEDEFWPSWSPDGTRIAYARPKSDAGEGATLIVVNPDGSHPVPLPSALVTGNTPVWSPDGIRLLGYHVDPRDGSSDGFAVFDASGSTPAITIPEAGLGNASWQRPLTNASWQRLAP